MHSLLRWLAFGILACIAGCAQTSWPGLPDLPQKDWLKSDKKESPKDAEKIPIYSADKTLGIDDLVWLAIQQSPIISKGSINLEVQEIQKRDAQWSYLPEMHLYYTISNNVTRKNEGNPQVKGQDYGETAYQLSFGGQFRNPVATYFNNKAQDELEQVAVVTQRKGIADVIRDIARALLQINLQEETISILEQQLGHAHKKSEYASEKEKNHYDPWNSSTLNEDIEKDLELRLRETRLALTVQRTRLKQLVGVDLNRSLKVDAKSVFKFLDLFKPDSLNWKNCWDNTEDRYLLRQQIRLEQANVMLAWAQYMPNIGIAVNENAPNGQAQPAEGQTDEFVHLTIDLPLLDWGHRWRMAEISGARKRQRQIDEIQRERDYRERWTGFEQELLLARARLDRREHAVQNARKRAESLEVAFKHGVVDRSALYDFANRELESRFAVLHAQLQLAECKLGWAHFASFISNHFLGKAGYQQDQK